MHLYLAPWVGTGSEDDGGSFRPPTFQPFTLVDFRADPASPDGWSVVAVAQRDSDLARAGAVWLGDDLDDPAAGRLLMRTLGLNPKLEDRPSPRVALLDLFFEHSSPVGDRSRWNGLRPTVDGRYEVWLGNERVVDLPAVSGGATYTDDFDAADANPISGSDLTWAPLSPNDMQIVSNTVRVVSLGANTPIRAAADAATDNNYAQAQIVSTDTTSTTRWGVACRWASGGTSWQNYVGYQGDLAAVNNTLLVRHNSTGTATTIGSSTYTKVTNEVIKVQADGSSISFWCDGTSNISVTDSTYPTGVRGGILARCASNTARSAMDNFEFGDIATKAPPFRRRRPAALYRR